MPWVAESKYVIPYAEKDSLPHASEGARRVVVLETVSNIILKKGKNILKQ